MSETRAVNDATQRTWLRTRLEAQLRLALLGDTACMATLAELVDHAQRAGLSGAEIDAALVGRSFEVRATALLAYALALAPVLPWHLGFYKAAPRPSLVSAQRRARRRSRL